MHEKRGILSYILFALAVFLVSVFFLSGTGIGRKIYFASIDSYVANNFDKFMEIESMLEEKYMGETDDEKMVDNAFGAYVDTLEDPYTTYLDSDRFSAIQNNLSGDYVGIGIEVKAQDGKILVVSVKNPSPAQKAGIVKGDFIVKVNSAEYNAETLDKAIDVISSLPENESVCLTVERQGEILEMDVKREKITLDYVYSGIAGENTGYIRIETFGDDIAGEFEKELESLKSKNINGLIIDLRSNPGGVLKTVVKMTDLLVPEGIITTVKHKDGKAEEYKSDKKELDLPMCVLINSSSASASEVMAGALRDFDKATIIGEKSFGKGIVQGIYEFGDGTAMRITIAKYYTPSGECIHGKGIEPDIEIKDDTELEKSSFESVVPEDEHVKKAIEVIEGTLN